MKKADFVNIVLVILLLAVVLLVWLSVDLIFARRAVWILMLVILSTCIFFDDEGGRHV